MRNLRSLATPRWMHWTSVDAGAGDGGGGAGGADGGAGGGAAGGGDGGAAAAWYEGLTDEGLKTNPSLQNFKTLDEIAKGYVSLEKRFGIEPNRRLDLPADPNDAEAMRAVYERLGAPKDADGYGFKLDDKATEGDKALVGGFSKLGHEIGLSVTQAQKLMTFMGDQVKADTEAQATAMATRAAEGKAALQKEFGQAFEARSREIDGLVAKYAEPELAEALKGEKLHGFPNLAKFLGKVLERMAEPGSAGGQAGDGARQEGVMTPAQAKAAVATLEGDSVKGKALREKDHPQHKAVVAERQVLLAMTVAK